MEEKLIMMKDGRNRKHIKCICSNDDCKKEIWKEKSTFYKCSTHFCNRKCRFEQKKNECGKNVECFWCGIKIHRSNSKLLNSDSGLYYCSREHQNLARTIDNNLQNAWPKNYGRGYHNYQIRAYKYYGKKCSKCSFDDEECLEVHHIDGDRKNGNLSNLEVLCANCHRKITNKQLSNRQKGKI